MTWLVLLRYGTVVGVVLGVIYWISNARYEAGYAKGHKEGVVQGTKATNELRDSQLATFTADRDAQEQRKLNEALRESRDRERYLNDRLEQDRTNANKQILAVVNERDRISDQLRDARAKRQVRNANSASGLPKTSNPLIAQALSTGILSERAERRIIGYGADAEQLNIWFGQCLRAYDSVANGEVIHE